jgi:hypothetical protein
MGLFLKTFDEYHWNGGTRGPLYGPSLGPEKSNKTRLFEKSKNNFLGYLDFFKTQVLFRVVNTGVNHVRAL